MLEKLEISIAQPSFTELSFRDITPTGIGGWGTNTPAVVGDFAIEDSIGWRIKLIHHELGDFGYVNRTPASTSPTYNLLFLQPNIITADEWTLANIDEYPDGVYVVKYNPFDDAGDPILAQDMQRVVLVIAKLRADLVKIVLRYNKTTKENHKLELRRVIDSFLLNVEVAKSLVLVDNYTGAVDAFKVLQQTIEEGKGLL